MEDAYIFQGMMQEVQQTLKMPRDFYEGLILALKISKLRRYARYEKR